jgi:uncharacterized protein (TIGR03083 family)
VEGFEVDALEAQLRDLGELVGSLSDADFKRPTRCPGWSVAELVAHCEGMLIRLVGENAQPVDGEPEIDRVGYYRYDPDGPREGEDSKKTFSDVIRERVIDEVAGRSGAELRASLERATEEALKGIGALPADRVIKRSGHPRMTFGEFVASRNLEFCVHAMDIADAVGQPERPNPRSALVVTGILDGLLSASPPVGLGWDAEAYILAGTGRRALSPEERRQLGSLAEHLPLLK